MPEPQDGMGPTHSSYPKLTSVPLAEMSERTREQFSRANLV